ncbi:MAG: hypothetical protein MI923_30815 [Phycisphaerales bacterium]|nr:hypothetical protein [Phycisphaerales bacterium]
MQLPQSLAALTPRGPDEIAAAAHATQANVVALRVAWCRLSGQPMEDHEIKTPAPGPVRKMREILVDRHVIKSYEPNEIVIRLRQIWGEFCSLCWSFPFVDPQKPINFNDLPENQSIRCPTEVLTKLDEIQKHLWRIRHEQRRRHDSEARKDPAFHREDEIALGYPLRIYGVEILNCDDASLFTAACEYAGMLAALRWASDHRWTWEAPGIMDVTVRADSL